MEKEFKTLLTLKDYQKILSFCSVEPVLQVNHYFLIDEKSKRMIRARQKKDSYEITYKRLVKQDGGIFVSEETNITVSAEVFHNSIMVGITPEFCNKNFSLDFENSLPCIGKMNTLRAKFNFFGFEIELDKNDYLFTADFEIEYECNDSEKIECLKRKLTEMGVCGGESESKSARFFKRKEFLRNKKYSAVLFDFDGTLCDTEKGITNSMVKTCAHFGLDIANRDLKEFFGPPIVETYSKLLGAENAGQAKKMHQELYKTEGYLMNDVYYGIKEVLEMLKQKDIKTGVATSRAEESACLIAEHLGIDRYFDTIRGLVDGIRENKTEAVRDALSALGTNKNSCLMIGDRLHDLEGAANNFIDAAGVLYGYGFEEELTKYPNIALVKTVGELLQLLDSLT